MIIKNSVDQALLKELDKAVKVVLIQHGLKSNSNLINSIDYQYNDSIKGFQLYVNNYYEAVSEGRKPKATKVPIGDLINWIKRYNISTGELSINQLAFLIQRSIYIHGVKGKKYDSIVEEVSLEVLSKSLSESLSKQIEEETALQINNKYLING